MSVQRYVSNELTHFVGRTLGSDEERYELLAKILCTGWLIAPGTDKDGGPKEHRVVHSYKWDRKLSDPEGLFSASTVCFCDIPVPDLGLHVTKYSRFGLAFSKAFLIGKGAAPVFYLPRGVRLFGRSRADDLDGLKDEIRSMHAPVEQAGTPGGWKTQELSKVQKFFEDIVLTFIKPFDETTADDHPDNYYMEREWRTITSIQFRQEDVGRVIIPEEYRRRLRENAPMYSGQVTFV